MKSTARGRKKSKSSAEPVPHEAKRTQDPDRKTRRLLGIGAVLGGAAGVLSQLDKLVEAVSHLIHG